MLSLDKSVSIKTCNQDLLNVNHSPERRIDLEKNLRKPLKDFRANQTASGIQDPALTTSYYMTLLISELLITENGEVDVARINDVLKYMQNEAYQGNGSKPYFMQRIERILIALSEPNSSLIPIIQSINAPENPDSFERCKLLINSTLLKSGDSTPTNRDAIVVALKHLLDEPRQLGTNTTKIEGIQINWNTDNLEGALLDASNLIQGGVCYRQHANKTIANTFPTFITCSELNKKITVNSFGEIQNELSPETVKIYEALPIKVALLQMGIPSDNSNLNNLVIQKLSDGNSFFTTDVESILYAYANQWINDNSQKVQKTINEFMEIGCYAFAALSNSPSQRAIVSIIAAITQHAEGSYPVCWIVECITKTFNNQMSAAKSIANSWFSMPFFSKASSGTAINPVAVEKVSAVFNAVLSKMTSIQFEQIQTANHKGAFGTFRLYQKNIEFSLNNPANIGLRIVSEENFQSYVQSAIVDSQRAITDFVESEALKAECLQILDQMKSYASQPTFVYDSNQVFNKQLGLSAPIWPPLDTEQKTVWNFGFFPKQELFSQVWYNTVPTSEQVKQLSYKSVDELMTWVFNDVIQIDTLEVGKDNPRMYQGFADSKLFAQGFNWFTENPTILNLKNCMVQQNLNLQEALDLLVKQPGLEVANMPINIQALKAILLKIVCRKDDLNQSEFFSFLLDEEGQNDISEFANSLDANLMEKLNSFISSFKANQLTIYSVSSALVNFLNKTFNPQGKLPISNAIDGIVTIATMRSLSKDNFNKIVDNAIHVADSNYEKSIELWPRNAHLAFYFNPVTESYGLAMITEGNDPFFYPLTRSLKNVSAIRFNVKEIDPSITNFSY